jgi:hypothetical protein
MLWLACVPPLPDAPPMPPVAIKRPFYGLTQLPVLIGGLLVVQQPHRVNYVGGGLRVYAIVYKSDGFPVCRQVEGVSPDPVVTWNTEDAAKAFISAKSAEGEFQAVQLTDDAMDRMAKAMGCPVESMTFEPYPS